MHGYSICHLYLTLEIHLPPSESEPCAVDKFRRSELVIHRKFSTRLRDAFVDVIIVDDECHGEPGEGNGIELSWAHTRAGTKCKQFLQLLSAVQPSFRLENVGVLTKCLCVLHIKDGNTNVQALEKLYWIDYNWCAALTLNRPVWGDMFFFHLLSALRGGSTERPYTPYTTKK